MRSEFKWTVFLALTSKKTAAISQPTRLLCNFKKDKKKTSKCFLLNIQIKFIACSRPPNQIKQQKFQTSIESSSSVIQFRTLQSFELGIFNEVLLPIIWTFLKCRNFSGKCSKVPTLVQDLANAAATIQIE